MAIFALVSVLLFVVAGLAVNAGTSYLTSNKLERARQLQRLPESLICPVTTPTLKTPRLSRQRAMDSPTPGRAGRVRG